MIRTTDWVNFSNGLSKDSCDKIIKLLEDKLIKVSPEDKTNERHIENHKDFKISDMVWTDEQWIFNELWPYMTQANEEAGWKYDIRSAEYTQIARYKEGMFYDWHTDGRGDHKSIYQIIGNPLMHGRVRKISGTIILNDDFEGGEFQFARQRNDKCIIETIEHKIGSITIFPADMWHRVTPVTKGIRYTLAVWFLGPPYK